MATKKTLEKTALLRTEVQEAVKIPTNVDIKHLMNAINEVSSSVEDLIFATEKKDESYVEENRKLEEEKDTLANLASIGILTVCFGHEVKEYSNFAATNATSLKDNYKNGYLNTISSYQMEFERNLDIITQSTDFVRTFANFALGNVRPDKRKRTNIKLQGIINEVFKAMKIPLDDQNIKIDLSNLSFDTPEINAFRIDCESILVNLLTNSIVAMNDTPSDKRLIRVELNENGVQVLLKFEDSGCGLEAGTEERIFYPMFSTKRDRKGNVIGTGMGLAIVKTIVEEHMCGTIKAQKHGRLGGAVFEIRIPSVKTRR